MSLRGEGCEGRIVLIGDESDLPYQRPPLSKGDLTGKVSDAQLMLRPEAFFASRRTELLAPARP